MRVQAYYTYMVASRTRVLYTGVTNNLERRVLEHRSRQSLGFTAKYGCHRLVWFEQYTQVTSAITREKELKGWGRPRKIALIELENPTWKDLSADWGTAIAGRPVNLRSRKSAQLGVYLRLNDIPVPALYGPSADEQWSPPA
jgi:putative endonuclease